MRLRRRAMLWRAMPRRRVVLLGTGGALNPERYQAAVLVESAGTRVLLDTGGSLGSVRRLISRASVTSSSAIAISATSADWSRGSCRSSTGAPGSGERPPPVRLYARSGSAQAIRASQAAAAALGERVFGDRLTWLTPTPGESRSLDGGVSLALVPVDHRPPDDDAAGCVVESDGARVVYSGDSRPCDSLTEAARGPDLLIHEAGGLDARAELVHQVGHSTAADGLEALAGGAREYWCGRQDSNLQVLSDSAF
jgi:ribonuclease BN (tRNA processing enzyme)